VTLVTAIDRKEGIDYRSQARTGRLPYQGEDVST
jgi:hypothetical protein